MTADSHRAMREQLGAYALGQLTGEARHVVAAHLESCAACRADLDEIAPAAALLAGARDRLRPGQLLDEPVGARPPASPLAPARPSRSSRRLVLAAAAALLVTGGAGFVAGTVSRPAATAPVGDPVASRAINQQLQASTRLVAHTWGLEIKIDATGFAAGQTYRVTVTDDNGRSVGAGEFIGTGAVEMRCNLNSSVRREDASGFQVADSSGRVVLVATL